MLKSKNVFLLISILFFCEILFSQRTTIPVDFRQHNITKYNASLINPALSFVRYETRVASLWGRIQWVGVDNSPTTYFVNYGGRVGARSGAGLALLQNNIGLFTDSGLLVNYARGIQLARDSWLTFGVNLIGFQRGLNQASFITQEPDPVLIDNDNDFIAALMPGIHLSIKNFGIGISSENFFDYNFTLADQQTDFSEKIFLGYLSYDYYIKSRTGAVWDNALVRTTFTVKSIPEQDTQFNIKAFLDVPKYGWIQAGYNNFFGLAGGIGAKVSPGIAIGILIESGTNLTRNFGATYEVTAAIEFGKGSVKNNKPDRFKKGVKKPKAAVRKTVADNTDTTNSEDRLKQQDTDRITTQNNSDLLQTKDTIISRKESLASEQTKEIDDTNIENVELSQLEAIDKDSDKNLLNKVFKEGNNVNPRYKVVDRIEGVDYGFYLVVNVFAQKKYFDLFMRLLRNQGLNPQSFYNPENQYYYVYLRKYDRLSNIERDRRTNYNGKYSGETWILWVRNN